MPQLPFKTSPRTEKVTVGDPRIGELEFEIHGSLLWSERDALRQFDEREDPFKILGQLSLEIAKAEGVEHLTAFRSISRMLGANELTDEEQAMRLRHLQKLQAFTAEAMSRGARRQLVLVTAGIANRLPGCETWDLSDTERLPESLIEAIAVFMAGEEARTLTTEEKEPGAADAELAEALGKSPAAPTNDPPNPTGEPSSGASSEPSPEMPASPPKRSRASRSTSSAPRSRRSTSKTGSDTTLQSAPSLS